MLIKLLHGDCNLRMAEMADASVGVVCCDPPYGLEFMGKEWDNLTAVKRANRGTQTEWKRPEWEASKAPKFQNNAPAFDLSAASNRAMQTWHAGWLAEAFRVLVPGGVIKVFGGTRVYHRLAAAMEEVGFIDIRLDAWSYGSGFPKSLNVGKAIDKHDKHEVRLRFVQWMKSTPFKVADIDARLKDRGLISPKSCFSVHFFNESQPALPTQDYWEVLEEMCAEHGVVPPDWIGEAIYMREHGSITFAQREVIGEYRSSLGGTVAAGEYDEAFIEKHKHTTVKVTLPVTDAAQTWAGWGTALKPAWEPVLIGTKPEASP